MSDHRSGSGAASKTSMAERLRNKIDSGKTRDKVGAPDPAMSPLGTDEEAAQGHDEEGLRIARQAPKPVRPA